MLATRGKGRVGKLILLCSRIHDYSLRLLTCGSCLYIFVLCAGCFRTPYFALTLPRVVLPLFRHPFFPCMSFPSHAILVYFTPCRSAARRSVDLVFRFDSMSVTQTDYASISVSTAKSLLFSNFILQSEGSCLKSISAYICVF